MGVVAPLRHLLRLPPRRTETSASSDESRRSLVAYADMAPTFHTVRALTAASSVAALAMFAATWDATAAWLAVVLAVAALADALYRRRRPDPSPVPRLLFDAAALTLVALVLGGPALIAAPFAYLLAASLLILPMRRAFLMASYLAAWVGAVYFSAIIGADGAEQWLLGLGALAVFLGALAVLLTTAGQIIRAMRRRQAKLLDEALATSRMKSEFLASVGHELRTPLTAVMGFAQLLRDAGGDVPLAEREEMIASIAKQAFDLSGIVDDLLVAARDQIGELAVIRVPVDLRAQAAQVLEAWDRESLGGITVDGGPAAAIGDPARVRQIVRNLVSNALRYGGREVRLRTGHRDGWAFLEVRDDGDGLPPEKWELIFEPYYRAHDRRGQPAAVGLGLAVSRRLARHMGGELRYRHEDRESVFELTLEASEGTPQHEQSAPVAASD